MEIKYWKRAEAMEKSIPELKAEIVCMCVRQNKNDSFEIHIAILRYIRNINISLKKYFKFAELLTKKDRPENGEANKLGRRRK